MNSNKLIFSILVGATLLVPNLVLATPVANDKSANTNQDYLIEKLNRLSLNLAPNDPSKKGITLRLADLLSERARQTSLAQSEGQCKSCVSPDADRKKALQYYNEVMNGLSPEQHSMVLVQVGHLNQLLGQTPKAIEAYTRLTSGDFAPAARSEAYLSMAEIYFKKSQWEQAQNNYLKSIEVSNANSGSKGFALYKLGWSQFNLNKIDSAKAKFLEVLSHPQYLSKSGSAQAVIDTAFHEQVAHDYAEIAGRSFDTNDMKNIYQYSPENKKLDNLYVLATELERTSKKNEAQQAWNYLYQYQTKPESRALTKAHMGYVSVQQAKPNEAGAHFAEAFSLISQVKNEKQTDFEDARKLIRSSIVTWNQAEKKAPSEDLLNTYMGYLSNFKFDKDMNSWAIQTAVDLKKWNTAWDLQQTAINQVNQAVGSDKTAKSEQGKALETQLLLGIELAENAKDPAMLKKAQDQYLSQSVLKSKFWDVTYQQAYNEYDQAFDKKSGKSSNENFLNSFTEIINNPSAPADLRIKTADLYMDYLASQKRDAEISTKGREFHQKLSSLKGYNSNFNALSQTATLNQVAQDVGSNKVDEAWARLQNFQVSNAEPKDVITYYKNKTILAEKRQDVDAALEAVQKLSQQKNLSEEDKTFTTVKMAHLSDLKMDFKTAMAATGQLPNSVLPEDKKNLKLAMYSDLLGQSNQAYLEKYIASTRDPQTRQAAIYEMIKNSGPNVDTLTKKYEKELSANMTYLSDLALMSYAKNKSQSYGFTLYKKYNNFKDTPAGVVITRDQLLTDLNATTADLAKMQLPNDAAKKSFQKDLARDMKSRMAVLNKLDTQTAKAIESKDWTTQTVALSTVSKESQRFYDEIMSLPMPEGLSPAEQGEYMNLLGQQAGPFKTKAEQASAKLKDFWSNNDAFASLQSRLNANGLAQLAQTEKESLMKASVDQSAVQTKLSAMTTAMTESTTPTKTAKPELNQKQDLDMALNNVKKNPFNINHIEQLKAMEEKRGNLAMVQYLDNRLNTLKNENNSSDKGVK